MLHIVRALACAIMLLAGGPAFSPSALAQSALTQKSFVRDDLASDAVRLEQTLKNETRGVIQGRHAGQLRADARAALAARNPAEAVVLYAAALALDGRASSSWLDYARALIAAEKPESWLNYTARQRASEAAYAAYQRAGTRAEEAATLAFLGDTFARRQIWRPALDAWKASLALADNARVRASYQEAREKHGFRITSYKVDNDAASPRICFRFSEGLALKTDFTPFVAVAGAANAAVSTEESQLCVEGLRHGERYSIVLRQGLPSRVDEQLLRAADYDIYVRDRSPQVRFTGKNYVLPRVGQEGIPVVSVNTARIAAEIYRIGDRSLLPTVRSDDFLNQIGQYRANEIASSNGVKVWTGMLDVKPEQNKDVITAFPIQEAVPKLEPGVYVMLVKPADGQEAQDTSGDDVDDYSQRVTQWFVVSDLGLTSFSGQDGVHVLVRSLASAAPLRDVEVRLVARNNEILGTAKTDATGHARFAPGLSRGTGGLAPGLVTATDASQDYNFLDLGQTGFDLTDRGVSGRAAPAALDAFLYTERGVYRPGETVFLTALLRDPKGAAVAGLPLTLVARRPDGVEYRRALVEEQALGGRAWSLPLLSAVSTGTWRVQAFADPKSAAIGEVSFLVEDYVPERLDVTATTAQTSLPPGEPAEIDVEARYLYGAPGGNLEVSGEVIVQASRAPPAPGLAGYVTGLTDEDFSNVSAEIEETVTTDAQGRARVTANIPETESPLPLEARIVLRVGEPGGRAVERVLTLPIQPKGPRIAVRNVSGEGLTEGATAQFDLVALTPDGARSAQKDAVWSLYRVEKRYQWYSSDGRWSYEPVTTTRRIADGSVDITSDAAARISAQVGWGAHRLDVKSADGQAQTSLAFNVGWSGDATAQVPDLLDVTLDKKAYAAGETMQVRMRARSAGKATIAIVSDSVHRFIPVDVAAGETVTPVTVSGDWGAGAYAVVLAWRPLDSAANRMPGRALGLAWFGIDQNSHRLDVSIAAPEKIRPRGALTLPIQLAGLQPGEEAAVTVAAVDLGILNLTRYETPKPFDFYFGQRRLGAELRDLYGYLIDGMQGQRGAIRTGGDADAGGLQGNRPTQEPLARYSGVVKVDAQGRADVTFDIPAFNGTARVMAIAWSKNRVGATQADVVIRDPVVVAGTLPRFLSLGDRSRFHMQLDNVEGTAGDYTVDLDVRGPVTVEADALRRTVRLEPGARASISVPVVAAGVGTASIDLRLTGPGLDAAQTFAVNIKPGTSELYRRSVRRLGPNESVTLNADVLADFLPGTGAISASVSPFGGIDVPALLAGLDRYPYGCSEQIVSRALPLLYVNRLASLERLALDGDAGERIRSAIVRVLNRQDSAGDFGLWSAGGSEDVWLNAYVTDFLTRARENGHDVPQRNMDMALERLRNHVANATDGSEQTSGLAYAIYVLARNGRPVMGDLRYLADTKLSGFDSPLARAQIAAALALLGDKARAQTAFASTIDYLVDVADAKVSRADYGSKLRDASGAMALLAESGFGGAELMRASLVIDQQQAAQSYTSTQEKAWMVMAAQAVSQDAAQMRLEVNGQTQEGPLHRRWNDARLMREPVIIANRGSSPAQVVVTTSGNPIAPEPAAEQGYRVERSFYNLDGAPLEGNRIAQNQRAVVVLKVTEPEAKFARLLLVDPLPAGLEIDNPRLVDGSVMEALSFVEKTVEPVHTEYRDDRFVAAFDRAAGQSAFFSIAYIVRAVTPGRYVLPPATAEDMYRPERFGRAAFGSFEVTGAP